MSHTKRVEKGSKQVLGLVWEWSHMSVVVADDAGVLPVEAWIQRHLTQKGERRVWCYS